MATAKTVLIIGGSGFLGTHLALSLRHKYKVFATSHTRSIRIPGVTFLPIIAENRASTRKVVPMLRPEVIIYAAGTYSQEQKEESTHKMERLYVIGAANAINASLSMQPKFIFISNSYVFDGMKGNYTENDVTLPHRQIGRLKLAGENVVKSKCFNYLILRTSPIFGRGNGVHPSFLDTLRMHLDRGERMACSTDELHSYASSSGFCEIIQHLIETGVKNQVFHYGGLTKLTQYEFAKQFAKRFNYDEKLILPKMVHQEKLRVNSFQNNPHAPAPATGMQRKILLSEQIYDYSLNSTQTIQSLKVKPLLLQESFDLIEKQLVSNL